MTTTNPAKQYIVTEDLEPLMRQWAGERYRLPPSSFFRRLGTSLEAALRTLAFPEQDRARRDLCHVDVVFVRKTDPLYFRHLKRSAPNEFWIALDDVYVPFAHERINATRIYDRDGIRLGEGRRPEERLSVPKQVARCANTYVNDGCPKKVILADDGTYTGDTIVDMVQRLDEREVFVTEIRMALATKDGESKIDEFLDKRTKKTGRYYPDLVIPRRKHLRNLLDWVCERDFYLGAPRSGRTVGVKQPDGVPEPLAEKIGHPYLAFWGDIAGGASITGGSHALSERLTRDSIELWRAVDSCNAESRLLVKDLPRFPGPGNEQTFRESQDFPAVEYLEKVAAMLFGATRRSRRR